MAVSIVENVRTGLDGGVSIIRRGAYEKMVVCLVVLYGVLFSSASGAIGRLDGGCRRHMVVIGQLAGRRGGERRRRNRVFHKHGHVAAHGRCGWPGQRRSVAFRFAGLQQLAPDRRRSGHFGRCGQAAHRINRQSAGRNLDAARGHERRDPGVAARRHRVGGRQFGPRWLGRAAKLHSGANDVEDRQVDGAAGARLFSDRRRDHGRGAFRVVRT